MTKYLIITKEKDYISNSKSMKRHIENTNGTGVMVYDRDGILIKSSTIKDGIVRHHGNKFYDGEPREWAIDFIKNNRVGDSVEDACSLYYKKEEEQNDIFN